MAQFSRLLRKGNNTLTRFKSSSPDVSGLSSCHLVAPCSRHSSLVRPVSAQVTNDWRNRDTIRQRRTLSTTRLRRTQDEGVDSITRGSTGNGEEIDEEPRLIRKAKLVINENSQRREKIANAVAEFAREYSIASAEDRRRFLLHLSDHFGVSQADVTSNAAALLNFLGPQCNSNYDAVSQRKLLRHLDKMRQSLIPAYDQLFTSIGALDNGVKLIVDIRAELLSMLADPTYCLDDDLSVPRLRDLDRGLKDLLSSWFSVGLLRLEMVDWQSPCNLLQKVSESERVHPIRSWTDIKQRVGPYRRCFIFTHRSMPQDPVMVLHTFLSDSISGTMEGITLRSGRLAVPDHASLAACADFAPGEVPLAQSERETEDPSKIHAAVFYSINNTQSGLKGVDLGHSLIKNAVKALQREFPHLSVFSTLSPIPGFKRWFMAKLAREVKYFTSAVRGGGGSGGGSGGGGLKEVNAAAPQDLEGERLFTAGELQAMMAEVKSAGYSEELYDMMLFAHKLQVLLSSNKWYHNRDMVKTLETPLRRLCTQYLYVEKHRGYALNPVANFHLRNGATLWRLNWLADTSPRGLEESFGLMVNYRYVPEKLEENNQRYAEEKIIDISEDVLRHLSSTRTMGADKTTTTETTTT